MDNKTKHDRWMIAGSCYQAIKTVVDILNKQPLLQDKFRLHYPTTIQVDDELYTTKQFEDKDLDRFLGRSPVSEKP